MTLIDIIILSLVQGISEFLPVSSSGHLVLFQKILNYSQHSISFDVAAHLGTLCSVLTVYRKILVSWVKDLFSFDFQSSSYKLLLYLIIATIPTAIIGLTLKSSIEALFSNLLIVGYFFIFTGLVLWRTKKIKSDQLGGNNISETANALSIKKSLILGLVQGLAIVPGVSRSGMTISGGLMFGMSKNTASFFSFLLAIPAICGAGILQLKDIAWSAKEIYPLLGGFIFSYFFGIMGLIAVLKLVKKGRLHVFSYYLIPLGLLIVINKGF